MEMLFGGSAVLDQRVDWWGVGLHEVAFMVQGHEQFGAVKRWWWRLG